MIQINGAQLTWIAFSTRDAPANNTNNNTVLCDQRATAIALTGAGIWPQHAHQFIEIVFVVHVWVLLVDSLAFIYAERCSVQVLQVIRQAVRRILC